MAYGIEIRGERGQVITNEHSKQMVFAGKAVHSGTTQTWFQEGVDINVNDTDTPWSSSTGTVGSEVYNVAYTEFGTSLTLTAPQQKNSVLTSYTIQSYGFPTIFCKSIANSDRGFGCSLQRITEAGTSGPNGKDWVIHVILGFDDGKTVQDAIDDITLYCFSEVDPNYSNPVTEYGIRVLTDSGELTFASELKTLSVTEVYNFTGRNGTSVFYGGASDAFELKQDAFRWLHIGPVGVYVTPFAYACVGSFYQGSVCSNSVSYGVYAPADGTFLPITRNERLAIAANDTTINYILGDIIGYNSDNTFKGIGLQIFNNTSYQMRYINSSIYD